MHANLQVPQEERRREEFLLTGAGSTEVNGNYLQSEEGEEDSDDESPFRYRRKRNVNQRQGGEQQKETFTIHIGSLPALGEEFEDAWILSTTSAEPVTFYAAPCEDLASPELPRKGWQPVAGLEPPPRVTQRPYQPPRIRHPSSNLDIIAEDEEIETFWDADPFGAPPGADDEEEGKLDDWGDWDHGIGDLDDSDSPDSDDFDTSRHSGGEDDDSDSSEVELDANLAMSLMGNFVDGQFKHAKKKAEPEKSPPPEEGGGFYQPPPEEHGVFGSRARSDTSSVDSEIRIHDVETSDEDEEAALEAALSQGSLADLLPGGQDSDPESVVEKQDSVVDLGPEGLEDGVDSEGPGGTDTQEKRDSEAEPPPDSDPASDPPPAASRRNEGPGNLSAGIDGTKSPPSTKRLHPAEIKRNAPARSPAGAKRLKRAKSPLHGDPTPATRPVGRRLKPKGPPPQADLPLPTGTKRPTSPLRRKGSSGSSSGSKSSWRPYTMAQSSKRSASSASSGSSRRKTSDPLPGRTRRKAGRSAADSPEAAKRPARRKPRSAPNSRGGAAPPAGAYGSPAASGSPVARGGVGPSKSAASKDGQTGDGDVQLDQLLTDAGGGKTRDLPPLDAILANSTAETRINREQLASSPYEWVALDADKSSGSMSAGKAEESAPPASKGGAASAPATEPAANTNVDTKVQELMGGKSYDELEDEMHALKVKMRKCDRLSKLRKRGRNLGKEQQTLLANKSRHQARLEEIKKIMRLLKS